MKKWLRFSLRTMLLLITALCIWLGFQVNAARRQREAVTAILRNGGTVKYDFQLVIDPKIPWNSSYKSLKDASPSGPAWIRRLIGDEYFQDVVEVIFQDKAIPETDFAQLAKLPRLRT